jgi:hypothetical protein
VLDRPWLKEAVDANASLIVELGAWRGTTTRLLASFCPNATIVACDTWPGGRPSGGHPVWKAESPVGLESFAANCRESRGRVIPVPLDALPALAELAKYKLFPAFVYVSIDAGSDIALRVIRRAAEVFPRAVLLGEHWGWWGMRRAVAHATQTLGRALTVCGGHWRLEPAAAGTPISQGRPLSFSASRKRLASDGEPVVGLTLANQSEK